MILIEAYVPAEGTAVAREGDQLRLLRPPYTDVPVLPREVLADAIMRCGFSPSSMEFNSWEEATAFLNAEVAETRRAQGEELLEIEDSDLLSVAPIEVVQAMLAKVEEEVIPQNSFEVAQRFLISLLDSDVAHTHPDVARRAVDLLRLSSSLHRRRKSQLDTLSMNDLRFPTLRTHGNAEWAARASERIRNRGCIFAGC